jgi:hypothetical protein
MRPVGGQGGRTLEPRSDEIYGPYTNEELVGRALKGRRDQVVLATKFGFISHVGGGPGVLDSSPANICSAIEGSLRRLGTTGSTCTTSTGSTPTPRSRTPSAPKGAQTHSCRSPVLMEQATEQVSSIHAAPAVLADEGQFGAGVRRLKLERPGVPGAGCSAPRRHGGPPPRASPNDQQSRHSVRTVRIHRSA